MASNQFLLYGANGYMGKLIAATAGAYDLQPILAGRREDLIRPMAEQYQYPYRIIDLHNQSELKKVLQEVPLVLHAAGPFKYTARPMVEACLQTNTHYLDITGEIPVFELVKSYDSPARQAGIMLLPGVGFDVVPTDCLSLFLKNKLPDASLLQLAFASLGGGLSHGTAITMVESLGEGGLVRENGRMVKKRLGHKGMWVDFGEKKLFVMAIPWGDISTAYHSTGIPNIETYAAAPSLIYNLLKLQPLFNWLLKKKMIRSFLKKKINRRPPGPSDEQRRRSKSLICGVVQNQAGRKVQALLRGPNGYTMTTHCSLIITKKVLNGNYHAGYQSPSGVYGEDLILEVAGTTRELIT
jgi:short subunit dehydrogenase-like uncharacterized protein